MCTSQSPLYLLGWSHMHNICEIQYVFKHFDSNSHFFFIARVSFYRICDYFSVSKYFQFHRSSCNNSIDGIFTHMDSCTVTISLCRIFKTRKVQSNFFIISFFPYLLFLIRRILFVDFHRATDCSCFFRVSWIIRLLIRILKIVYIFIVFFIFVVFAVGNCAFLIGPIVGWIRDITQSYVICFHSLTFIMCLCAVPWFIEIALLQICHKKREK